MSRSTEQRSVDSGARSTVGRRRSLRGYDAFISYSQAVKGGLAPALQAWLERFATPWYKPRAMRIFRDYTSLSATEDLGRAIQDALAESNWLILLASPEAAASKWVRQEVAWWRDNKRADRVLIVRLGGELTWNERAGDWDWSSPTMALPPTARGMFEREPLWVDLSSIRTPKQLDRGNPELANRVAQIAAPLRGMDKDELIGQHITYERRARRQRRSGITGLIVLLVLSLIATTVAVAQRNTARRQTMAALSRQLVAEATSMEDSQPDLARQLLVESYRLAATDQATGALLASRAIPRVMPIAAVSGIAFSQSRNILAVAAEQGAILYDTGGDGPVAELSTPLREQAIAVAFSDDGRLLAIEGTDSRTYLVDVASPRNPTLLSTVSLPGAPSNVSYITLIPHQALLALHGPGSAITMVDIRSPRTPRVIATWPGFEVTDTISLKDVAVSPDGRLLASSGGDGRLRLWSLSAGGEPTMLAEVSSPAQTFAFSTDGQLLAAADGLGGTGGTRVWDVAQPSRPRMRALLNGPGLGVDSLAFSTNGRTLAVGGSGIIQLWDLTDPTRPLQGARLTGHTSFVESLAFSGDDRILASASADGAALPEDKWGANTSVRLWNLIGASRTSAVAAWPANGSGPPVFGGDGRTVAAGFPTTVWDIADRNHPHAVATVPTTGVGAAHGAAISPDGHLMATGTPLRLWDLTDRAHPRALTSASGDQDISSLIRFSPSGPLVAAGAPGGSVQLWDVTRPEHPTNVASLGHCRTSDGSAAFSSDGRILATVTDEGDVELWDVTNPASPVRRATVKHGRGRMTAVSFSSTDAVLLAGDEAGGFSTWDTRDPSRIVSLATVEGHTSSVSSVAYDPTGTLAASAGTDGSIRLWELADPSHPVEMAALSAGDVLSSATVAFSPDGRTLAAGTDNAIQLWDIDIPGTLQRLCAQSVQITSPQWLQYLPNERYDPPCA